MSDAEARVTKLAEIRERLENKLSDPTTYASDGTQNIESWQMKFAEVEDGLKRAEALWLRAVERLERATN